MSQLPSFRMTRPLRRLLCAGFATTPVLAMALPPITYEGRFESSARTTIPAEGEQSMQLGSSSTLDLRSYIWQPWFATAGASFSLSQVRSYAAQNSTATVITGDGSVQVFPRSRFPFSAFVGVSDSRAEFESVFVEQRQVRRTRFGAVQQFRPLAGNAQYTARIERNIEDGIADRVQQVSDRLNLDASYSFTEHNLDGSLSLANTTEDEPGRSLRDLVATLRHSYRPSSEFSVDNFVSFTDIVSDAGQSDVHSSSATLNSFSVWRPSDKPLTVTSNARLDSNSTSSGAASNSTYGSSLNLGANYELSRAVRVSGTLSGAVSGGDSSASTSQSLTLSYSPDSITVRDYDYNWFASASANNSTGESASRGASAVLGHGASRVITLGKASAFSLSGNVNESVSTSMDTDSSGVVIRLNHGASAVLAHSVLERTSRAQLTLQDSRSQGAASGAGGGEDFVQSATLQIIHDSRLARASTLGANLNLSVTRVGLNQDTQSFFSSSLSVNYRNSRLFGFPRLRFESLLSVDSDSLGFIVAREDGRRNLTWTNRMDYSIGRIDMRLNGIVTDTDGRLNTSIFLTVARRIGGVF